MSRAPMKRYVAESTSSGVEMLVQHSDHPDDASSLEYLPGGYEWGYEGAGPTRLAYALLSNSVSERFSEQFMKDVVSKTSPIEEHRQVVVFYEKDILRWLRSQLIEMEL